MEQRGFSHIRDCGVHNDSLSSLWLIGSFDHVGDRSGKLPELWCEEFGDKGKEEITDLQLRDMIHLPKTTTRSGVKEKVKHTELRSHRIGNDYTISSGELPEFKLHSVSHQDYSLQRESVRIGYFEFKLIASTAESLRLKDWITGASRLLHVGMESVSRKLWNVVNVDPRQSYVVSLMHVWGDEKEYPDEGLLDATEMLCAGLPGDAEFDSPMGKRNSGVPTGVAYRSARFYYYANRRRFGCVMANSRGPVSKVDPGHNWREDVFPTTFRSEMLGVAGLAMIENHIANRCTEHLVEVASLSTAKQQDVESLRDMNRSLLLVRSALGNGQVSPRHGVQLWYDWVVDGLRLEENIDRLNRGISRLLDVQVAELQAEENRQQSKLLIGGVFVAGALAYATFLQGLSSSVELDSGWRIVRSSAALEVYVPMVGVGLLAVFVTKLVQFLVRKSRIVPAFLGALLVRMRKSHD